MYKNQLQELAQRSCFNLPAYSCIREGPDHAPRFKATVNFNGEKFESPAFCSTLRQAEHAAAEVALNTLAKRGPSRALAARVLDETGVYKNLLQETAHRAGLSLPVYTTVRSGPGHVPVFSCTVDIAGMSFVGDPARTKKQAQKNAAMVAWSGLRKLSQHGLSSPTSSSEPKGTEEQEQVIIARVLANLQPSKSNNFKKSDEQQRHRKCTSNSLEPTLPRPVVYPMQCQSWAYSSFSPDIAMYQIWQQEQILQQQNRLLTLSVSPAVPPSPQIYPLMQSMFQPDHYLYFPARELEPVPVGPRFTIATSSPSFCFSNHMVPNINRDRSTVTIREIHDEKIEESSEYSTSAILDRPICNVSNESRIPGPVQEDYKLKLGGSESNTGNYQLEGNQTGNSEWDSQRSVDLRYMAVNFQLQSPPGFDSSQPIMRAQSQASSQKSFRPSLYAPSPPVRIRTMCPTSTAGPRAQHKAIRQAAPPRMRTGVPPCSSMSGSERYYTGGAPPPLFMAPAVRIRSVMPVCSAPSRQMPSSNPDEGSKNREKKDFEHGEVSRTSSDIGNLKI
ncbi:Double-stranded RNA-binding protein [Quillaja saponaria]|uniref:Double-stranded RNA-binding protein n=1 Tax=Quillaja saponaria TaxID=32244 RepID=A0AAD7QAQ9_QUISA|nr:Double-stranded RNA-binding protein [Quillaja saponaria]